MDHRDQFTFSDKDFISEDSVKTKYEEPFSQDGSLQLTAHQRIGIFDSGVGGLTVVKELMRLLPKEELVYFGDTARFPYGDKSPATIRRYASENSRFLMEQGIKLLVVACNTASACALEELKAELPIPVIGVIDPLINEALDRSQGSLAILATHATISSCIFEQKIKACCPDYHLFSVPCPLFVPLVEERLLDHPATKLIVSHYLLPLRQKIDTVLLACTHYPFLAPLIQSEIGPEVLLIDSARSSARAVLKELTVRGLLEEGCQKPSHRFFVSDAPEKFGLFARQFLHPSFSTPEVVKTACQEAYSSSREESSYREVDLFFR